MVLAKQTKKVTVPSGQPGLGRFLFKTYLKKFGPICLSPLMPGQTARKCSYYSPWMQMKAQKRLLAYFNANHRRRQTLITEYFRRCRNDKFKRHNIDVVIAVHRRKQTKLTEYF